ncbi:MAG: crossover junction endodeoxyribonuclease RuvC [Candidatus Marinimicrobia bacterium]|jgi:crossover junction endodeoxyribonuclease RuvC|nr:crossover junction endodeoxyribonuclease RuvC [Candidatus Neomarinimicrobiota bacterium]MDD4962199.1 crossover junction endodeoxyribonuclease RuvC [Candidatus Neomarinimicrobiota bacterium]MDD5709105.1 crossover junction endodeoxyribonuclease RuvC [Candidatus Neomarinimicrobiota bacterium]MDX9778039.1 crossover junction endodeoxyribonuclease RuvC [bacterium]
MIILGIDPGLNTSGYGLIRVTGSRLQFLAAGTITTSKAENFSAKLGILYRSCCDILDDYHPDVYAIEETYSNVNPRTSLKLGHARGVLMLAAHERNCPVFEYPAAIVKKSLTGRGGASKDQVRYMVLKMLKMPEFEGKMDVSDALAVAITHFHHIRAHLLTS